MFRNFASTNAFANASDHLWYSQGVASVHDRLKCERCAIDVRSLFDYRTDNERTTNEQRTDNERTTNGQQAKEVFGKSMGRVWEEYGKTAVNKGVDFKKCKDYGKD